MVISSRTQRYDGIARRRLSRRSLLAASARAGVGAAGLALVGCGEDEPTPDEELESLQEQADGQAQQVEQQGEAEFEESQQQAERVSPSEPEAGGILRVWYPVERHDRWDPHRSRYRTTQGFHSLMYSRILRPVSVSSGELEADLCGLPEMPDEVTYVFTVSSGAAFWNQTPTDGRSFTADDIRWNIERQQAALDADGVADPYFFRSDAYERTASIDVVAEDQVRLTTSAPDAAYLGSVHAGPFAWMTSPEAAELWGDAWRDNAFDSTQNSGTGPYLPMSYDGAELILQRSESWWGPEAAWPDGIVFAGGGAASIVGTYSLAQIDFVDFPVPNEIVQALIDERPEDTTYEVPIAAPVQLLTPQAADSGSALGDPRVVRALGLAVDRARLIERLYEGNGRASGLLPWYLDGWAIPQERLGEMPGYRDPRDADLTEIGELIAAAGGASAIGTVPLVTADLFEGFFAGSSEAVRSMIADATGLTVELEHRPFAEALEQLAGGERFVFLAWGETPVTADPTDAWRATLHSGGDRNWGGATDPELDALIDEMGVSFGLDERRELAHRVQERLLTGESAQWIVNLANGTQLGVAQPYLQLDPRAREFAWSWDRLGSSWLDTGHADYNAERELPEIGAEEQAGGE